MTIDHRSGLCHGPDCTAKITSRSPSEHFCSERCQTPMGRLPRPSSDAALIHQPPLTRHGAHGGDAGPRHDRQPLHRAPAQGPETIPVVVDMDTPMSGDRFERINAIVKHRYETGDYGNAHFRMTTPFWEAARTLHARPAPPQMPWDPSPFDALLSIPIVIDDDLPGSWRLVDNSTREIIFEGSADG